MESYVETKASIHVFRLCAQHAQPGAPLGRFPPELIEMIATEVQNAAFDRQLQTWQDSTRCCANKCRPSEHLSEEDYESLREEHLAETDDCSLTTDGECGCDYALHEFEEYLAESGVGHDEHMEAVETFIAKVEDNSYIENRGRFAKCRKVCSFFIDPTMEAKQSA